MRRKFLFSAGSFHSGKAAPASPLCFPKVQPMTDPRIEQIAEWLQVFIQPNQTTELRALGLERGTVSRIFRGTELAQMALLAADLEQEGAKGVYFIPNPLRPSLSRSQPARDSDVLRRNWLLIDIDPVRPANTVAIPEQRLAAWRVSDRVYETLQAARFPSPVSAESGNGFHLCYRIDMANDNASRDRIRKLLHGLHKRCSDEFARVDTSTFNAARIWRLYGIANGKGKHEPATSHNGTYSGRNGAW
jgi:hypothetical protein